MDDLDVVVVMLVGISIIVIMRLVLSLLFELLLESSCVVLKGCSLFLVLLVVDLLLVEFLLYVLL